MLIIQNLHSVRWHWSLTRNISQLLNHQDVFLKKKFYQNDWFFDSKLEDDLAYKSENKKVKIDLTLTDFAKKKTFKSSTQSRIEKQKTKIEHRKLKIAVWNLTTISQRFKTRIQKMKTKSFRNLSCGSVGWKAIWKLKIILKTIKTTIAKTLLKMCKRRLIDRNNSFNFIETLSRKNTNY